MNYLHVNPPQFGNVYFFTKGYIDGWKKTYTDKANVKNENLPEAPTWQTHVWLKTKDDSFAASHSKAPETVPYRALYVQSFLKQGEGLFAVSNKGGGDDLETYKNYQYKPVSGETIEEFVANIAINHNRFYLFDTFVKPEEAVEE